MIALENNKLIMALSQEAFHSQIITLKIGDKAEKVVLKDVQMHPTKPKVTHVDFFRISSTEPLTMTIPIHFIGEEDAVGVKEQGGVLSHVMTEVEVKCLPADLPEFIEMDISAMELDQILHLTDLKLPKGVELTAFAHGVENHDQPVVSIHPPRVEVEPEPEEEEEGEETGGEEGAAQSDEADDRPEGDKPADDAGDKDQG